MLTFCALVAPSVDRIKIIIAATELWRIYVEVNVVKVKMITSVSFEYIGTILFLKGSCGAICC